MRIKCMKCLKEYEVDESRIPASGTIANCKICGNKFRILPTIQAKESPVNLAQNSHDHNETNFPIGPSKLNFAHFVGPNASTYLSKFQKFNKNGDESFSLSWHWPAFFVPPAWFLYRKLYLWSFFAFLVSFLPVVNLLVRFVWGVTANFIYYKKVKNRLLDLKLNYTNFESEKITPLVRKAGGVNQWVPYTFAIIPIVGIVLAVAVPNFIAYQNKQKIISIESVLLKAAATQSSYYEVQGKYAISIADFAKINKKLNKNENIEIEVLMANHDKYIIAANSKREGTKFLLIGPERIIKRIVSDNSNVTKAFSRKELNKSQTDVYGIIKSLGYEINDVEPIGILFISDNNVVICFKILFDDFEGAFFWAPEVNRYVIYNEPDDMPHFNNFLKMDIQEKINYVKNDFKKYASYEFSVN